MNRSNKRLVFFGESFHSYIHICFQLVAFIREYMWHKDIGIGNKWVWVSLGAPFISPVTTYVLWWKQQARNIHVCKNEIDNSLKNTNLLVYLFLLKYLLSSLFGPTTKKKFTIYIYIYIYKEREKVFMISWPL